MINNVNVSDGLINRLDIAEERISEFETISRKTSKTERNQKKKTKKTE